jgi:hypothetical protein
MGLNHGWRGPNIVRDGLVLYLDAGSPNSYQGAGTTWKDISKVNQNNGTLVNGPTFNSSNGGSIVFDGVDDAVTTNYNPNFSYIGGLNFSLEIWFYLDLSSYNIGLTCMRNGGNGWVWAARSISNSLVFSWYNGTNWVDLNSLSSQTIPSGKWNLGNMTYESSTNTLRFYLNGVFIGNFIAGTNFSNAAPITLIRWDGNSSGYSNPQQVAKFSVYNRTLSADEVLQNYNATKGRFGL